MSLWFVVTVTLSAPTALNYSNITWCLGWVLDCRRFSPECLFHTALGLPFHYPSVLLLVNCTSTILFNCPIVFFSLVLGADSKWQSAENISVVLLICNLSQAHVPWIPRVGPSQWSYPTLSCGSGTSSYSCPTPRTEFFAVSFPQLHCVSPVS